MQGGVITKKKTDNVENVNASAPIYLFCLFYKY